jgi:hypothetical protein
VEQSWIPGIPDNAISCVSDVGDLPIRGCGLIECPWRWGHGGDGPCFRDHAALTGDSGEADVPSLSGHPASDATHHQHPNHQHAHSREVQERASFSSFVLVLYRPIRNPETDGSNEPSLKRSRGTAAPWAKTTPRTRR